MRKMAVILLTLGLVALSGCQLKERRSPSDQQGTDAYDPYNFDGMGGLPGDPMEDFLNPGLTNPAGGWDQQPQAGGWSQSQDYSAIPPQQEMPIQTQEINTAQPRVDRLVPIAPLVTGGADVSSLPNITTSHSTEPQLIKVIYPSPEYGIVRLDKVIPQEVSLKQKFKYTIVVTNLTNTMLSNLLVSESLSQAFQFSEARPQPQVIQDKLVWQIDSLGPKSSQHIEIVGTPLNIEALKHCTSITYAIQTCSTIQVVEPSLDLQRRVPAEVLYCDTIPIEYIVKNTGSGAARDVRIVETLPQEMRTTDGRQEIVFDVGTLLAGQARSFTVELRANRIGTFSNKARATSSSGIEAISATSVTNIRQPILAIVKNNAQRHYLGRPLTYEITVENRGDGNAQEVILEETLPPGATQVEALAGAEIRGSKLIWQLGTIPAQTKKTVEVSYRANSVGTLNATTTVNGHCCQTASISSTMSIVGLPAVRLSVVDLNDPVEVGENVTYVITAENTGSAADHNIRVSASLEAPLQYVSTSGATQASLMGRTISFQQLRTLSPGETVSWRVVAKAIHSGEVRFKVSLSSDGLSRPIETTEATFIP